MLTAVALAVVLGTPLHSQAVHLCCTSKDCQHRKVQPNLRLIKPTHVFGVLADPSGAKFERSKVELRQWLSTTKQVPLQVAETDNSGRFDLGKVEAGQYRFLPSPNGGFKQPENVSCSQAECQLTLVLQVNPTDVPEFVCPIR